MRGRFERFLLTPWQSSQAAGFERPTFTMLAVQVEAGFCRRKRLIHIAGFEEFAPTNPVIGLGGVFAQCSLDFSQGLVGCTGACAQA